MSKLTSTLTLCTLVLLPAATAQGSFKTGLEVMQAQDRRPRPKSQTATLVMEISRGGSHQTRSLKSWSLNGGEKQLIKFLAPADVKGSGMLSLRSADGSKQNSLWLPALGKIRRQGAGEGGGSFFGSDFTTDDIGDLTVSDYEYKLLGSTPGSYTVEATPKKASAYQKLIFTVNAKTLLNEKIEYYNDGAVFKTLTARDFTTIGNYTLPRSLIMETPSLKSKTTLKFTGIQVDTTIAPSVFTEKNLMK